MITGFRAVSLSPHCSSRKSTVCEPFVHPSANRPIRPVLPPVGRQQVGSASHRTTRCRTPLTWGEGTNSVNPLSFQPRRSLDIDGVRPKAELQNASFPDFLLPLPPDEEAPRDVLYADPPHREDQKVVLQLQYPQVRRME